ncbi:MAG: NAD(P)-dependent oxidoreductase, partial [Stellaceae bacterium]
MATERLGFIGLGVMGLPMAGHLAKAGYRLTVHDRDSARAARLKADHPGIAVAPTPDAVAAAADIVITMLPSGREVGEIALGTGGLIEGFGPGALLLDTSSAEPWLTRETAARLHEAGIAMVDAPVSGAEAGAKAAELVFMVGGATADVARPASTS